jgi:mannose-6-phosphate isomerase-like protein (cupin superfamily)
MQVFDCGTMMSYPYEEKDKNVFYKSKEFKARIIELSSGGKMPSCEMASYVVFFVIAGAAEIKANHEKASVKEGHCLIAEPGTLSMETKDGVKLIGIQIEKISG